MLTLATKNLSADGGQVMPGQDSTAAVVSTETAHAALTALAQRTALELAEADARIYLTGPLGKVAVQAGGGRLYAAPVPESANIFSEATADAILALVITSDEARAATATADARHAADELAAAEAGSAPGGGTRSGVKNLALAVLVVIAAVVGWMSFHEDTGLPDDVVFITDAGKLSRLHASLNGNYGAPKSPGQDAFTLRDGEASGYMSPAELGHGEPLFRTRYRLAERGGRTVFVTDRGALYEVEADGTVKFFGATYARL